MFSPLGNITYMVVLWERGNNMKQLKAIVNLSCVLLYTILSQCKKKKIKELCFTFSGFPKRIRKVSF